MTSEFYEQLGVDRGASSARIRQAYGQACSRLAKRRRAMVEQGGATAQIDLQRTRLDEAWAVLSDPLRRRRYDALLTWTEGTRTSEPDAVWKEVGEALVHPAAAVAAKLLRVTSKLQEIGQLPLAPSGAAEEPPTLVPHDDDLTSPRAARLGAGASGGARSTEENTSPRLAVPKPSGPRPVPPRSVPPASAPAPVAATPEPASRVAARSVGGDARELLELGATPGSAPTPVFAPRAATPAPVASRPPPAASRPPAVTPTIVALAADVVSGMVDDHGYSGSLLSAVRQKMGLTVQDVADHTRISVKYLEAVESMTRAQLPSSTFVRGYVREVARLYQLDVDNVVAGYMRRFDG